MRINQILSNYIHSQQHQSMGSYWSTEVAQESTEESAEKEWRHCRQWVADEENLPSPVILPAEYRGAQYAAELWQTAQALMPFWALDARPHCGTARAVVFAWAVVSGVREVSELPSPAVLYHSAFSAEPPTCPEPPLSVTTCVRVAREQAFFPSATPPVSRFGARGDEPRCGAQVTRPEQANMPEVWALARNETAVSKALASGLGVIVAYRVHPGMYQMPENNGCPTYVESKTVPDDVFVGVVVAQLEGAFVVAGTPRPQIPQLLLPAALLHSNVVAGLWCLRAKALA